MVLAGTGRIGWDWWDWLVLMGLAGTGGICTRQGLVGLAGTSGLKATITTVPKSVTQLRQCVQLYTHKLFSSALFFSSTYCAFEVLYVVSAPLQQGSLRSAVLLVWIRSY